MNRFFVLFLVFFAQRIFALTGEEILEKMDAHRDYKTVTYTGTMRIHIGDAVRVKKMKSQSKEAEETRAVVEFLNPEDQGTKFLMLGKNLWIYFPDEEETVKISGHMLKEGMMGSDVSYEDALESDKLSAKYAISLAGEEKAGDRACYVIALEAKVKKVPYYKRKIWVDKAYFIPWKEEMYAKSGKLLKESRTLDIKKIGKRWIPVKVEMVNKLRKKSKTVFEMEDLLFDEKIDDKLFSMRYLRR